MKKSFKNISINPHLEKAICPTSKSYANRLLILSALSQEEILLTHMPTSEDVDYMVTALKNIGLNIECKDDWVKIKNSFPECEVETNKIIEIGEGGTTFRFISVLLSLGKNEYTLRLAGKLAQRPQDDLQKLIEGLGGQFSISGDLARIKGPIKLPSQIEVDCTKTTQFATAFMLLEPFYNFKTVPVNVLASQRYLDQTQRTIEIFSKRVDNKIMIPYDASSLGYFFAFGSVFQKITVSNVSEIDPFQADSFFYDLLSKYFANVEFVNNQLCIKPVQFKGCKLVVDGSECLDLVPTLIFFALATKSEIDFKNIYNLKFKECDRLKAMIEILNCFQAKYTVSSDENHLFLPKQEFQKQSDIIIETEPDHRMIMVAALFLFLNGGGKLNPIKNISKSFKEFFTIFAL